MGQKLSDQKIRDNEIALDMINQLKNEGLWEYTEHKITLLQKILLREFPHESKIGKINELAVKDWYDKANLKYPKYSKALMTILTLTGHFNREIFDWVVAYYGQHSYFKDSIYKIIFMFSQDKII